MSMKPGAVIDLVEACYRDEPDESRWLGGIADAAGPLLADGLGTKVSVYRMHHGQVGTTNAAFAHGCAPEWMRRFYTKLAEPLSPLGPRPPQYSAWFDKACGTASSLNLNGDVVEALREFGGARDFVWINGRDPSGFGVWLGAPRPREMRRGAKRDALFARVAAHLASGYRLRRQGKRSELAPEAVLHPNGQVAHAEANASSRKARLALQQAVLEVERARSVSARHDPQAATKGWRGLTSARWSLVDQFESDGRRFVVAFRNDVDLPARGALSGRELQVMGFAALGHTNKEIAYELGLSLPTVRVLMHRSAVKLGVRLREDAIMRFLALPKSDD